MNPKKFARKVIPASGIRSAEETYRKNRIRTLQLRYGYPARNLQIIAVTGTNGKTTTCMLINSILKQAGYKTALFTTAVVEVAGEATANLRHTTVPVTAELLQFFQRARNSEVDYVVLEVTSHALHQHKLLHIPIEVAVITNLSQDHLDYHGTMEEYAAMKARLFNKYISPSYCILNHDDPKYDYFEKQSVGVVTSYGSSPGSLVSISQAQETEQGSSFTLKHEGEKVNVNLPLVGSFNVANAAAAAAAATVLGLSLAVSAKGLAAADPVPGRMQRVAAKQSFDVFIDYAVTPDALEKALTSLKARTKGKVIVVFGATGDRDKAKRSLMGEAAARCADKIFVTDDETYTEDPAKIRSMVLQGIKKAGGDKKTKEIADREQAIAAALKTAKKGDSVLITGIGHQDSRNIGGKLKPWSEEEVIYKNLGNIV